MAGALRRCAQLLRRNWPLPLLSALLEDRDGRFHEQAHQRCGEVPLVGVLGDDVEPVDGEETVRAEHDADEHGATDGEAQLTAHLPDDVRSTLDAPTSER